MKAYRDADLFMIDIECIFCQTVIPALPSNANDGTTTDTFQQDIQAAELLSQKGRELLTSVSNIDYGLLINRISNTKLKWS